METIKIIDLLNMIAKGEEVPKKIWLRRIWRVPMTYSEEAKDYYCTNNPNGIFEDYFKSYNKEDFNLNEEVEILDEAKEDKIQKIYHCETSLIKNEVEIFITENLNQMVDKINELIDAVNSINKGK